MIDLPNQSRKQLNELTRTKQRELASSLHQAVSGALVSSQTRSQSMRYLTSLSLRSKKRPRRIWLRKAVSESSRKNKSSSKRRIRPYHLTKLPRSHNLLLRLKEKIRRTHQLTNQSQRPISLAM